MGLQKLKGSQFEDIVDRFPKMNAVWQRFGTRLIFGLHIIFTEVFIVQF